MATQVTLNSGSVDSAGSLALKTNGTTTAVTIDTSQNVGIGTASPAAKLGVNGFSVFGNQASTGTDGTFRLVPFGGDVYFQIGQNTSSGSSSNLIFTNMEASAERMRINSSGNVGIGNSSPSRKLEVTAAGDVYALVETTGTTGTVGYLFGDSTSDAVGRIEYVHSADVMTFTTASTERARIDSSGNLLVGTTNTSDSAGNGVKVLPVIAGTSAPEIALVGNSTSSSFLGYSLYSSANSTYRFYVAYNGTISAQTTTISGISDVRLKENIRDLDDGLNKVMALKPRKFDWKEGKGADIKNARGFIAQEFETVFPDLIDTWKDPAPEGEEPYKSVRADLIPTLVKAIQEQQAIITQLQADVAALKGNA